MCPRPCRTVPCPRKGWILCAETGTRGRAVRRGRSETRLHDRSALGVQSPCSATSSQSSLGPLQKPVANHVAASVPRGPPAQHPVRAGFLGAVPSRLQRSAARMGARGRVHPNPTALAINSLSGRFRGIPYRRGAHARLQAKQSKLLPPASDRARVVSVTSPSACRGHTARRPSHRRIQVPCSAAGMDAGNSAPCSTR